MTVWNDGYLVDTPYPHLVQRELSPAWLGAVLTALGQRAPALAPGFRYCELGCGQGLNSLLMAAAYPAAEFVAVDFNAQHIAHGRRMAQTAGLDNLRFVQVDFAELAESAQEQGFDFIVLHGVYSWVSAANRVAIQGFVDRALKHAGVLYLGYMSHPGLSAFASAQRLLWASAQAAKGDARQRLQIGLQTLRAWRDSGAGYFIEHPDVAQRLARNTDEDLAYLAHELLCEHWTPLHSADVIDTFAAIGCSFVGSATALENIDALSLPANCLPLLAGLDNTAQRESAKDIARNQSQRRDIFVRHAQALDGNEHRHALLNGRWAALPGAPQAGAPIFDTRIGPVQGSAQLFDPLLQALAQGPQFFAELAQRPGLAAQIGNLSSALQSLLWAGFVHPLHATPVNPVHCHKLNRLLVEGALQGAGYAHLAAPGLGGAVVADLLEMAAARVLMEHPQLSGALLHETTLALLRRHGHVPAVQASELIQHFERHTLPIWRAQGVLG